MGKSETSRHFQKSCSQFVEIECDAAKQQTVIKQPIDKTDTAIKKREMTKIESILCDLIREKGGIDGLPMSSINPVMLKFGVKNLTAGKKTWRSYLMARPELFACGPKGPDARVRLV
jgi:hypothetical protein